MFLQVYNTGSTNITNKTVCSKTQAIKCKNPVTWSQRVSSQSQKPRRESDVETLSGQTALVCILCMCVHTHSKTLGLDLNMNITDKYSRKPLDPQ